MIKRNFTAALVAAGMFSLASMAQAIVVDLGSSGSGTVGGAIFETNNDHPTGTGVYNPFLTIQNNGWEQGYNSSTGNFDTKREPQWNHEIRFSDLQVTTINGMQYFGFSIDINEPGGSKSDISLDGFKIWTSSTLQTSTSTNGSGYFNGSLGTLRYDLGNNQVLYDDQNTGSGGGDINIYVPVSNFAGAQANDYVYLYERFGNSDATEGGFEETSLIRGLTPVPEMSTIFPIVGLLVAVGSTSLLRRRRAAQAK
ncbi:MAG TPA: hypothetical protein VM940_15950 [Chthoniobacterales bacterium]|jgi:hypothetical protein|nr:hypothetical protein [Chthoniobacterales bacterium]